MNTKNMKLKEYIDTYKYKIRENKNIIKEY